PLTNVGIGLVVEGGKALAHNVSAGDGNEKHEDGRQRDCQPQASTPQALAIIRITAVAATIATTPVSGRMNSSATFTGFGDFDRNCRTQSRHDSRLMRGQESPRYASIFSVCCNSRWIGLHDVILWRAGHAVFIRSVINDRSVSAEVVVRRRRCRDPLQSCRLPRIVAGLRS